MRDIKKSNMFRVETQESVFFDDLTNAQYGLEFSADQLGPSEEASSVRLYRSSDVGLIKFRYCAPHDQRLRAREKMLSFGLLDTDNPPTWSYDQLISNDALVIFPHDDEIKGITPVGCRGSGINIAQDYLSELSELVFRRPLKSFLPASGMMTIDSSKLKSLRTEVRKWQQLVDCSADSRTEIVSRRQVGLALAILDALFDEGNTDRVSSSATQRHVSTALEIIHNSELDRITAAELCTQSQCSQRTLEKGFSMRFGVTPKKYINFLRLARVHKGLRNFDTQECDSIIELASIQGFWHMGQFAADYRRVYGELPSETLNRN